MSQSPIPADDPTRAPTLAAPDDPGLPRVALAGDVYTILISGSQTAGRHTLIDMLVPDGGGPPPHRHDFEETFTLLEGELEFTCRGRTQTVRAPATINIPANAPHAFRNASGRTAHMLCLCAPAGQDEFFRAVGIPVESRALPPPRPSEAEQAEGAERAVRLAPRYRTELLG